MQRERERLVTFVDVVDAFHALMYDYLFLRIKAHRAYRRVNCVRERISRGVSSAATLSDYAPLRNTRAA